MKPQDTNEKAVIGILLRNPEAILRHEIDTRWFSQWRFVVEAMLAVASDGAEVDILSICEKLKNPKLASELWEIQKNEFSALQNLPTRLAHLKNSFRSSQMLIALHSAVAEINGGGEIDTVINQLMQSTLKAAVSETKNHNFTMRQAMSEFVDYLDKTFEARSTGGIGLKTGLKDLDAVLGGMHPSDLIVVGARPGVGKTAFGTSVLLNLAKQGKRIGFISSEMSAIQVMLRATAADSGIAGNKLRDANLTDEDWARLTTSTNRITDLPVRIFDKPAITLADVALQSKAWMIDGGIDFVVIDYLTRVKPVKSLGNQNLDVAEVVTGIKNIARQLNIPVMLLAQLNRDAAGRMPLMSDLRDSGVIEQEADQILLLYRPEEEIQPDQIIVEKNRHGESKVIINCTYVKEIMLWANSANGY